MDSTYRERDADKAWEEQGNGGTHFAAAYIDSSYPLGLHVVCCRVLCCQANRSTILILSLF